jgi:hypothetical protein
MWPTSDAASQSGLTPSKVANPPTNLARVIYGTIQRLFSVWLPFGSCDF